MDHGTGDGDDGVLPPIGGPHPPVLAGGPIRYLVRAVLQAVVDDDGAGTAACGHPFVEERLGERQGVRSPAHRREHQRTRGQVGQRRPHGTPQLCLRGMTCCHGSHDDRR